MQGLAFAGTIGWIVYQCYKDAIKDEIRAWRAR